MPTKFVDVFLRDRRIETYALEWGFLDAPLFEQDFIDRARAHMKADGYRPADIAIARFSVRDAED